MIQNVKKQFLFQHISIWLSGLRGQALAEVISGSNPGSTVFGVLAFPFARGFSFAICKSRAY
jgi:hypothetical protein